MKRTRAVTTAVMMAAGLLIGGCTSTPHDRADDPAPAGSSEPAADRAAAREPQACRGGAYTWFNLRQDWVINGVADAQLVTTRPARVTKPIRRLRTDPVTVETEGADLDPESVLHALGAKVGLVSADGDPAEGSGVGGPGTYAPLDEPLGRISGPRRSARLVSFSYFKLIEADFRYTCAGGGKPVVGHVSTWGSSGGGAVNCDETPGRDASSAAREAVRLSC